MFCKNCGNEIKDDATFCDKCGKQVTEKNNSKSNLIKKSYLEQLLLNFKMRFKVGVKNIVYITIVKNHTLFNSQTTTVNIIDSLVKNANWKHILGVDNNHYVNIIGVLKDGCKIILKFKMLEGNKCELSTIEINGKLKSISDLYQLYETAKKQ